MSARATADLKNRKLKLTWLFISELLVTIFQCLYNSDVISEEGFDAWSKCTDPAEQDGKGVACQSTTHFFTWMRENDDPDDGEDEE